MANSGGGSTKPSNLEREVRARFLASAAGLPRVCALKRCRRRKRCLGNLDVDCADDLPCLRQHAGLMRMRMRAALALLGWSASRRK